MGQKALNTTFALDSTQAFALPSEAKVCRVMTDNDLFTGCSSRSGRCRMTFQHLLRAHSVIVEKAVRRLERRIVPALLGKVADGCLAAESTIKPSRRFSLSSPKDASENSSDRGASCSPCIHVQITIPDPTQPEMCRIDSLGY